MHSELIIGKLLGEKATTILAWTCWLKHAKYLSILTQHVITRPELVELERLIDEHQKAFQKVCPVSRSRPARPLVQNCSQLDQNLFAVQLTHLQPVNSACALCACRYLSMRVWTSPSTTWRVT